MIVKDVEKVIERCFKTVEPYVDELVIVDTGSTDGTLDVIRKAVNPLKLWLLEYSPRTHPESFIRDSAETWEGKLPGPFTGKMMLADFGAARQFGWERATGHYLLWLDSDDTLENGAVLRDVVESMEKYGDTTALARYDYAHDARGNVTCQFYRDRIVKAGCGRWMYPVHECIEPVGKLKAATFTEFRVVHRKHEWGLVPEIAHRNLKILMNRMRGLDDERLVFHLAAEELKVFGGSALTHFDVVTQISKSPEVRSAARVHMGKIHEGAGRLNEAFFQYAAAMAEWHPNPDGEFGLARVAYFKKDWAQCALHTERGMEACGLSHTKHSTMMHDPMERKLSPLVYYSVALTHLGRMREVIHACAEGLKLDPTNVYLLANKRNAEHYVAVNKQMPTPELPFDDTPDSPPSAEVASAFAMQTWKIFYAYSKDRAARFLETLPPEILSAPWVKRAREMLAPGVVTSASQGKLDIVLWTGPAWEEWSPASINTTGIGGSETAAVRMAQELAARGHRVRVYSHCGKNEGVHGGAEFLHYEKFLNEPIECDVFVCSRQAMAMKHQSLKAKVRVLWAHDVHCGLPTAELSETMLRADKILCLSEWHRGYMRQVYDFLDPSVFSLTRNSIDMDRFIDEPKKLGNRLIYSSSADRGLERLLGLFPRIRHRVPDAELHIFYGFETWEACAKLANNQDELNRIARYKSLIKAQEGHGVVYRGRVSQKELAKEFLASKVWSYSTWFAETHCITALEAQAAGCVPVTTALAALPETVQHGILINPPDDSEGYAQTFVDTIVHLLQDEVYRSSIADAARAHAKATYGWDKVSADWEKMFFELLEERRSDPLIPYGVEARAA